MQCLKCGREIQVGQVFCPDCLADMEKYPVKPGTPIRIPKRQEAAPAKKRLHRHPQATPEEQVKRLKRRLWAVSLALVVLLALVGAAGWLTLDYIRDNQGKPLPGQNYSSASDAGTTEPAG